MAFSSLWWLGVAQGELSKEVVSGIGIGHAPTQILLGGSQPSCSLAGSLCSGLCLCDCAQCLLDAAISWGGGGKKEKAPKTVWR